MHPHPHTPTHTHSHTLSLFFLPLLRRLSACFNMCCKVAQPPQAKNKPHSRALGVQPHVVRQSFERGGVSAQCLETLVVNASFA